MFCIGGPTACFAQTLTTLHNFAEPDGENPFDGLVQGSDGNYYGTAGGGGATNNGPVFKMTPSGGETVLYSFCSQPQCVDGTSPYASLVQGTDGNFYGTTSQGGTGSNNAGTAFKVTPVGTLTTLHDFCSQPNCTDGNEPISAMVQATDGNFYGTTVTAGTGG